MQMPGCWYRPGLDVTGKLRRAGVTVHLPLSLPGSSKMEWRAIHELIAGQRRAPIPLDVRNHLLVPKMMPARIPMKRVR
jgi:hypothetical protein